MRMLIVLTVLLLSLSACENAVPPKENTDSSKEQPKAAGTAPRTAEEFLKQIQAAPTPKPVQRFVPLPESAQLFVIHGVPRPYLALDTMTGQLCRTWDFSLQGDNGSLAPKRLEDLPTCWGLYTHVPGDK